MANEDAVYLKEGVDYELTPENKDNKALVKFITEDFKGVIISINTLKFANEENPDESLDCSIDYDILDPAGRDNLDNDPEFNRKIGDVVMSMLITYLDATKQGMVEDDNIGQAREVNIEESDNE